MRTVPVFPLPQTVFFPRTSLPLHIFEARYRTMVRDAMAGNRLIAVNLLRSGWEAGADDEPEFFDVGTLGRIEELELLPDGRSNLRLVGLERVRCSEIECATPYRQASCLTLPESLVGEHLSEVAGAKLDLLGSYAFLSQELGRESGGALLFDDRMPFEVVVNAACAGLPVDAELRQELLELDCLLERRRMAADLVQRILEAVVKLKCRELSERDERSMN